MFIPDVHLDMRFIVVIMLGLSLIEIQRFETCPAAVPRAQNSFANSNRSSRIARMLSGPDPLRSLRVALRIEISTRCVFCVAGQIFIVLLSLPNLVLKLNLNMSKRLRVEAAYRSKTLRVSKRVDLRIPARKWRIENCVFNPLRF